LIGKKGIFMGTKRSLSPKLILLAIAVFLALSSCENIWMRDILNRAKKNTQETSTVTVWNNQDFGPDAAISDTFDVSNTAEWVAAKTAISGGGDNKNYIINVTAGIVEVMASNGNTFGNTMGIKVSLRGAGRTLAMDEIDGGNLISIGYDQTVILRDLTLRGHGTNDACLVKVTEGTFIMQSGKISGNLGNLILGGGGVYMEDGTFTMNGGTISGNYGFMGGGVYITGGTFAMHGGEISGNDSSNGGGVRVDGGTFAMHGGKISGAIDGGGVYVGGGTFAMYNGEISVNANNNNGGGGVQIANGTFTMHSGKISGNTSAYHGGGVYVGGGTFAMNGGEISGNAVASNRNGGGVYVYPNNDAIFTMRGGEISGNNADNGGGVFVYGLNPTECGTFQIVNGTIYGSNEATAGLRNNANSGGASLYNDGGTAQRGTFSGTTWNSLGDLDSPANNTIRVVNGALQ
jgi:hypothetical protein